MSAAGTVFAASGYRGASARDIAGAVGMQTASLHAHVQRAEDLVRLIGDRASDEFVAAIAPIAADHGPAVRERPRAALLRPQGRGGEKPAGIHGLLPRPAGPPTRAPHGDTAHDEGMWRTPVAGGVASGELRARDPKFAAITWLSAANGLYGR